MRRAGALVLAEPNSGIYQYTLSMLEALRFLQDWTVTLYTTVGNNHYDGLGYPVCRVKARREDWPGLMIQDALRIPARDPFVREDVLIAPFHSPILLHTRKPFVYTLHDVQEHYFPQNFSWPRRRWRSLLNSRLTKRAARIICESNHVRRDIIRLLGTPAEKVIVIAAPPVTMIKGNCGPEQLDAASVKYDLPDKYLFYPAQFWPHKNHVRLIDAFALVSRDFPEVQLVLTGKPCHDYEKVFDRVRELGLDSRVHHLGYVQQSDLYALYRNAVCLVMPSLFESVSIPVYEAFQCGTPICASNVVAIPEQVGDAGLLFDPTSIDSIAGSICTLLGSEPMRHELAQRGRDRFETMSHDIYARQLSSLLRSVCA